jgi:hypothetical protein
MPCSPDRVAVFDEYLTLFAKLRRGKLIAIVTKCCGDVPTAVSPSFSKVYVRGMGMIVGENEYAIALEGVAGDFGVREEGCHESPDYFRRGDASQIR